ncbi:hypothetical protein SLA2020_282180 [Shorea laevis]
MSNLALVLLVLALCMSTQPLICNAYRVHIENGFQKAILGAHCKSRDNDLGLHLIPAHSEYYWSFDGNFIRTTLYFCDFSWEGGHRTFDVFKYDDGFLSKYCPHLDSDCRWRAQENGIFAYNYKTRQYDFIYKW